jgi:hypothetical protein
MGSRASTWLERLVDERVVVAVVVFNLLVLFVRAFQGSVAFEALLFQLDYACLVYFFVEMGVKIRLAGWRGFWARAINRFDFLLVLASTPTLIAPFTPVDELSVVLVFRAARVLRLLRLLRFIPHAEMMWAGVMRALRASVGFMVALVAYNLLLGIIGAHMFGEVVPEHFAVGRDGHGLDLHGAQHLLQAAAPGRGTVERRQAAGERQRRDAGEADENRAARRRGDGVGAIIRRRH